MLLATTWPVWRWYWARMTDGSDEPLGLLALASAALLVPRRGWTRPVGGPALAAATGMVALYVAGYACVPALVRAALALGALACVLPQVPRCPKLPLVAMLTLSLPVIASLQFYLGFPLRALTTWCAAHLLGVGGLGVVAHGTVLRWAGEEILVDAPCSGIRMLWTACYVSTALAGLHRLPARAFLRLLRVTGLAVFAANLVRTVVLFLLETGRWPNPAWAHEAVGLGVFAAVVATCAIAARGGQAARAGSGRDGDPHSQTSRSEARGIRGVVRPAVVLAVLAAATLRPVLAARDAPSPAAPAGSPSWPDTFEGAALRPAALLPVEARLARDFPGATAAFEDGSRRIIMRWVRQPTRRIHPIATCLRAGGFSITPRPAFRHADSGLWGVVAARKDGRTFRIREHIVTGDGTALWTDVSSWYWSALLHGGSGPWLAITVIEPRQ